MTYGELRSLAVTQRPCHSAPYRYAWPSELDLMAKITGFRLRDRWAGCDREPFTSHSQSQVTVFEKLP
jgi:hypothetical protein